MSACLAWLSCLLQGKEVQNVLFLVEGEVEIVLDLPYTQVSKVAQQADQQGCPLLSTGASVNWHCSAEGGL
jgi:hypothetical protein